MAVCQLKLYPLAGHVTRMILMRRVSLLVRPNSNCDTCGCCVKVMAIEEYRLHQTSQSISNVAICLATPYMRINCHRLCLQKRFGPLQTIRLQIEQRFNNLRARVVAKLPVFPDAKNTLILNLLFSLRVVISCFQHSSEPTRG